MFSSISTAPEPRGDKRDTGVRSVHTVVACARPLMHTRRAPLPSMPMPSTSLHLDRHKIVSALAASGVEMEVEHLPEFTRNSLAMLIEEAGRAPDVLVLCGSGTGWDERLIVEDGFGSIDQLEHVDMHLLIPQRPKLLVAVGSYSDKFAEAVTAEGVAPVCMVLDDSEPVGAHDAYEFLSMVLKAMLRGQGRLGQVKEAFETVCRVLEGEGRPAGYASLRTALRAVAPPMDLPFVQGTCRVVDKEGMATLRARQHTRVFRQLGWDGRSEDMWGILDAMEKTCTHNKVVIYGPAGCGRTDLAAQTLLWMIDRCKVTATVCGCCDSQADLAHRVTSLESLYDIFGALLSLGMAARKQNDLRKGVLLRTLRSSRAVLWLDDWQCLEEKEQNKIAQLLSEFPPTVRVIITLRGSEESRGVRGLRATLPDSLFMGLGGISTALGPRMFFVHMERCLYGDDHVSRIKFENRFHRAGGCSELGDLDKEARQELKELCDDLISIDGRTHILCLHILATGAAFSAARAEQMQVEHEEMIARDGGEPISEEEFTAAFFEAAGIHGVSAKFKEEQGKDYAFNTDVEGGTTWPDGLLLWPALCVLHYYLTETERRLAVMLLRCGAPFSGDEIAFISGETPQVVTDLCSALVKARVVCRTPAGLYYVVPCVRDAINMHMQRRSKMQKDTGDLFRLEDFRSEPWVMACCESSATELAKKAVDFFGKIGGAWAELMTARHLRLEVESVAADQGEEEGAGIILSMYDLYYRMVRMWFFEWDRGGMAAPGGFEAALDGRHLACRPLPVHYIALRNALMQTSALALSKDRQRAACEAMSGMLFQVGDYEGAEAMIEQATVITEEANRRPY